MINVPYDRSAHWLHDLLQPLRKSFRRYKVSDLFQFVKQINDVNACGPTTCKRKEPEQIKPSENRQPKKPRLVFTDIQRRTLHAIFKETKRPSKEMQASFPKNKTFCVLFLFLLIS
ncbi:unnamed protein product [Trichobilharzia regenti]|nr:unnamed protein product [Trichobilharzia regenti]